MTILAAIIFIVILFYIYCGVVPKRLLFEAGQDTIVRIPGDIHLSFDDGPDPEGTPAILDILKKHNKKAYFFLVGERVQQYPEIAKRILQEGHIIGNHSTSHPSLLFSPHSRIKREIDQCQQIIASATGCVPQLVRPPYGQRDYRFYQTIRHRELKCMLWSIDSFDFLNLSMQNLKKRFFRAKDGDIILAHDRTFSNKDAQDLLDNWLKTNG